MHKLLVIFRPDCVILEKADRYQFFDFGKEKRRMQPRRVLIVEDEINLAAVLLASLEKLGPEYAAEVAYSGPEALTRITQDHFTLLVTDYAMPGMNGLELARRARQASPDTQIILMTAYTPEKLLSMAGDVTLDGVLTKPFSIAEFRRLVEQVC